MEDAQDFGWATAKGAHALILCRMEEGKVDWLSSEKLDRLRRAHAQKIVTNTGSNSNSSKIGLRLKGPHVNFTNLPNVVIRMTTLQVASCTDIFALIASV